MDVGVECVEPCVSINMSVFLPTQAESIFNKEKAYSLSSEISFTIVWVP